MSTHPIIAASRVGARRLAVLLGTILVTWWAPAAADAHLRSGTLAVDYRVTLRDRATAAYDARIYQSDYGLTLTVHAGHVVVLVGYLGEPVFRLDGRGLSINAASPTAVAVSLLSKSAAVDSATPAWHSYPGRRSATWHDARAQALPAGLNAGAWHVPLIVDGHRALLEGELRRVSPPALWLWLLVLGAWLVPGAWMSLKASSSSSEGVNFHSHAYSRRERKFTGGGGGGGGGGASTMAPLAGLAAAAATLATIGFALDAYASPGTWILGFDAIAFLAAGLAMMLRGPGHLRPAGAIGAGLVALAIGLFMIPVFLHPIVLSVLPGTLTRLLAVTAIGAGLDAAALGGLRYAAIATIPHVDADSEAAGWIA